MNEKSRKALAEKLKKVLDGEVRFDDGSRAVYSTDASNYRQVPLGVVIPRTTEDILETFRLCREVGAPIVARGGGTSLAGQGCNEAVLIDTSKYLTKILEINPEQRFARVESGVILDDLRHEAEKFGLTFGPDPATHNHCTLGGMIGNNSCGVHSVMSGTTAQNLLSMTVLTYDGLVLTVRETNAKALEENSRAGEIYKKLEALRIKYEPLIRSKFPNIPRRVSGYNLPDLLPENGFHVARALTGSESTCVFILEAKVKLVTSPPKRTLVILGYPDIAEAADQISDLLKDGPIGLEAIDELVVRGMRKTGFRLPSLRLLPEGKGWLFVEFGGETKNESDEKARRLISRLKNVSAKFCEGDDESKEAWKIRESALAATSRIPGEDETWEGWEDSAVPPERLGAYLRELRKLYERYHYYGAFYGHFGEGCLHTRINFDLKTKDGISKFRSFVSDAADLVVSYGGSLSGEHGDGQSRAEFLPKMFGNELVDGFKEFKAIWDPQGKMNPHKIIDPFRIDQNLKYRDTPQFLLANTEAASESTPPKLDRDSFQYPDDERSFARATERCVGVGECRRFTGGTMCPSYRVTREEKHSTRGRARLLFEMLNGEVLKGGWKNEEVKEALDLCLACKGCKSECPVGVDMATYKAEFLAHYYKGKLRPLTAYTMGLIPLWARFASKAPWLANLLMQTKLAKQLAGISPLRKIPRFPPQSLRVLLGDTSSGDLANRDRNSVKSVSVVLWPDTFTNYFHPEIGLAAVEVLEKLGFNVIIPERQYCCGRPLYDFGMLGLAKKWLTDILNGMAPWIRDGVSFVGLEPSCVAVFRDELRTLFPDDARAQQLSRQFFTLSEFLEKENAKIPRFKNPPSILVQGHCHEKSIMTMKSEEAVLAKTGASYKILDAGCCGMAGAFGFEKDHYKISMQIAEQALFPEIRSTSQETLILANGFSCREQIDQAMNRKPLHLAELLKQLLEDGQHP